MLDWLDRLRERPVEYRRRLLFVSTTLITLLIVGVWLLTLGLA